MGYVKVDGATSWAFSAAPYVGNIVTFLAFLWICARLPVRNRALWINCAVIGLVSPLVDSVWNYWGGLIHSGDVFRLLRFLPAAAVHTWFAVAFVMYVAGLTAAYSARSRRIRESAEVPA